jgi:putative flippase GtrA
MRYVFSDARADISSMVKFIVFVVLSAIGLGINQLAMWTGVEFFYLSPLIVKFFATAIVAVWNFVTRKLFYEREPKDKKSINIDTH